MAEQLPSFGWGGTGAALNDEDMRSAVFDRSLPFLDTLGTAATSGFLQSRGVGTAVRDLQLPDAAPTAEGQVLDVPGSQSPLVVETPSYLSDRLGGANETSGDYLGARAETPQELGARRFEAGAISEDEYKAAPYFRADIPWSPAMTADRAQAQADIRDAQKVRDFFQERRPITSFFGQIAGGAVDPVNYIPVAGPLVRAAAVARMGRILGTAAVSAGDAAINQALASALTAPERQQFGDDVSWQAQVTDIAMGALTGGIIGGAAGAIGSRLALRTERLENQMKARAVLDDAVGTLARDGEVSLTPTSAGFVGDIHGELRPFQNFDDFMQMVEARRRSELPIDPVGREAAGLRDTTAPAPEVTTARFTPLADLNIRDPEAIARSVDPESFTAFDTLTSRRDELRAEVARLNQERAPAADAVRSEIDEIDAGFNRTPPDGWPALEARKADAEARLAALEKTGDTEPLAQARAALQDVDVQLRDLAPKIGQALETGRQQFRTGGISPDVLRVLRDFDMQGGVRFSDRPTLSDWTSPVAATDPARIQQAARAEAAVGKPEGVDAYAKDVGFDPVTGESVVTPLVRQIEAEGRLTAEDTAAIKLADDGIADADAFSKALEVATGCVI